MLPILTVHVTGFSSSFDSSVQCLWVLAHKACGFGWTNWNTARRRRALNGHHFSFSLQRILVWNPNELLLWSQEHQEPWFTCKICGLEIYWQRKHLQMVVYHFKDITLYNYLRCKTIPEHVTVVTCETRCCFQWLAYCYHFSSVPDLGPSKTAPGVASAQAIYGCHWDQTEFITASNYMLLALRRSQCSKGTVPTVLAPYICLWDRHTTHRWILKTIPVMKRGFLIDTQPGKIWFGYNYSVSFQCLHFPASSQYLLHDLSSQW